MPTKDPVLIDEARHDRLEEAQIYLYERCLVRAREEFTMGELTDRIRDLVADNPIDATNIALHMCFSEHYYYPVVNVKDFIATVEGVIEDRAKLLMEDL